jgi:hypothetical protein
MLTSTVMARRPSPFADQVSFTAAALETLIRTLARHYRVKVEKIGLRARFVRRRVSRKRGSCEQSLHLGLDRILVFVRHKAERNDRQRRCIWDEN